MLTGGILMLLAWSCPVLLELKYKNIAWQQHPRSYCGYQAPPGAAGQDTLQLSVSYFLLFQSNYYWIFKTIPEL